MNKEKDGIKKSDEYTNMTKLQAEIWYSLYTNAETRQHLSSDEFIKVQIQIAGLVLAFNATSSTFSRLSPPEIIFGLDGFLVSSVFLMVSLVFGVFSFYTKSEFWKTLSYKGAQVHKRYLKVLSGSMSQDELKQFKLGIFDGKKDTITSPKWAWSLQSLLLVAGILSTFGTLFII